MLPIGWGQEVRLLSQTEALEEAMENNKTVQISGKQMENLKLPTNPGYFPSQHPSFLYRDYDQQPPNGFRIQT